MVSCHSSSSGVDRSYRSHCWHRGTDAAGAVADQSTAAAVAGAAAGAAGAAPVDHRQPELPQVLGVSPARSCCHHAAGTQKFHSGQHPAVAVAAAAVVVEAAGAAGAAEPVAVPDGAVEPDGSHHSRTDGCSSSSAG